MNDSIKIKWVPRKINLEVSDLNNVSPLYEMESLEDFQGEFFHKKGFKININHMIKTEKYGDVMFVAPNPIEFYLYGTLDALRKIEGHNIVIEKQLFKNNDLIFEMMSFLMYLYSGLEALINQKIPQSSSCKISGKHYNSKEDIERFVTLENKIKRVMKLHTAQLVYWQEILDFIALRNDVVHLKTAQEESDFRSYDALFKKLLDFNYSQCFENVKKIMKEIYEQSVY